MTQERPINVLKNIDIDTKREGFFTAKILNTKSYLNF